MPRKIQVTYTKAPVRVLAAMGDSLTHNVTLGVPPQAMWPERLAVALRALATPIRSRNCARAGDTTTNMIARFDRMIFPDVPTLAIIWGGANDPGSAIAGTTTQANIEAMGQDILDAGADYLLVGNTQYLNYSTGGDTLATPYATYATLRTYQQAAADALIAANPGQVAYCDIYDHMRDLIVAGTVTQGDWAAWHVADANQHLNADGEQIVADAMLAAIQSQAGWLAALQAG